MIIEAIVNLIGLLLMGIIKLFPKIPEIDTSYLDGLIRVLSLADTFVSLKVVNAEMILQ